MQRIGIYAGTFDPVHKGHIALAREAMSRETLDKIVFLPEPQPRHKSQCTALAHRVRMLQLALKSERAMEVVEIETHHFSVAETLPQLRHLFPAASLVFIIGSDVATSLGQWPGVSLLIQNVSFVVGVRQSEQKEEVVEVFTNLAETHNVTPEYTCIKNIFNHVSSATIRQGGVEYITKPVYDYIQQNKLYH